MVCNKGFSTSSSLNTHKRIHSGEKPHQCLVCGKKFTASSNLYYHRMTHIKVSSKNLKNSLKYDKLILIVTQIKMNLLIQYDLEIILNLFRYIDSIGQINFLNFSDITDPFEPFRYLLYNKFLPNRLNRLKFKIRIFIIFYSPMRIIFFFKNR